MAQFSIRDIESLTGIKTPTLRMWEQRYGIIIPKRTGTNIRYYNDDDLREFLNIGILNEHGFRISQIARMSPEERHDAVLSITASDNGFKLPVKSLISAMLGFDEFNFHKILNTNIIQYGFAQTMMKIVFPFLNEVGILWQVGSIYSSHEHFASNIIRQTLYVAIEGQTGRYTPNSKHFLLFLPEGEQHSTGLLFANYLIRSRGHEVIYLGDGIPVKELGTIFAGNIPHYIFTAFTTSGTKMKMKEIVVDLSRTWPACEILISGQLVLHAEMNFPGNVLVLKNAEELNVFLNSLDPNEAAHVPA